MQFFKYHLKSLGTGCSCFSKRLIKMKKLMWIYIFTLLLGPSKSFLEAAKVFIKLVETRQWSLKIKNWVNIFFPLGLEWEGLNILHFKSRNVFNFCFMGYVFPDDLFLVATIHALRKVFLSSSAGSLYILPYQISHHPRVTVYQHPSHLNLKDNCGTLFQIGKMFYIFITTEFWYLNFLCLLNLKLKVLFLTLFYYLFIRKILTIVTSSLLILNCQKFPGGRMWD